MKDNITEFKNFKLSDCVKIKNSALPFLLFVPDVVHKDETNFLQKGDIIAVSDNTEIIKLSRNGRECGILPFGIRTLVAYLFSINKKIFAVVEKTAYKDGEFKVLLSVRYLIRNS